MFCDICTDGKNITLNTDCVIECLDKIKLHYLLLRKELNEKDERIQELQRNDLKQKTENISLRKRPKSSCDLRENNIQEENFSNIFGTAEELADLSSEDLDIALSSQNDFECMCSEGSTPTTPSKETLTGTEKLKSPSVLLSKQTKRDKFKKNANDENVKPLGPVTGWISKEKDNNNKPNPINVNALKPNNNKKCNLSLRSQSTKLKQTRLQIDRFRVNTQNNSTTCEEAISPSQQKDLEIQKCLRSYNRTRNKKPVNVNEIGINFSPDESIADDIFLSMAIKGQESPPLFESENQLNSPSIVLLTPPQQIVLQIDESIDYDSQNTETMHLLKNMKDAGETQIRALKRLELKNIQELQRENQNIHAKERSILFQNKVKTRSFASNSNIKLEKPFMETNENVFDEHSHDFNLPIGQPMRIKKEPVESVTGTKSDKRKFDVDCDDCQKYIKFLGNNLTDREIEEHIRNCTKHKNRNIHVQSTPDGFWDPFMSSFDENDPRNETLIDTRFIGKTRRT